MKNILFIVALVGVLLSAQLGFGALINLSQQAPADTVEGTKATEGAVSEEGKKLASNAGLLTAQMIGEIKAKGDTYDYADSTISPLLFSEDFAVNNTQQFADAVSNIEKQNDQVAVIIAISMNPEDIKKAIEGKVSLAKVVIVQATTMDSQEAFNALFEEYKDGFSLREAGRNNSALVVKALQGAV